jgi:hypothetical protein
MKARLTTKMTTFPVSFEARFACVVLSKNYGSDWPLRLMDRFGFNEISSRCAERIRARAIANEHQAVRLRTAMGRLKKNSQRAETRKRKNAETAAGNRDGHVPSSPSARPGPAVRVTAPSGIWSPPAPARRLRSPSPAIALPGDPSTPGISAELVSTASLAYGVINDPPVQCHFIALLHAFLPINQARYALLALPEDRDPVLRLMHVLGERRTGPISLREVEAGLIADAGFPEDYWDDWRDPVETRDLLFRAADDHGANDFLALFRFRIRVQRVSCDDGCPRSTAPCDDPVAIRGQDWAFYVLSQDLLAPGAGVVPWLGRTMDPQHCTACGRVHGWWLARVLREAPAILQVQVDGVALNHVWVPLGFNTTVPAHVEAGANVPETEVHYELASFVRYNGAHCIALVRRARDSKVSSWVLYDDARVDHYTRLVVRDGWLRDQIRIAFYVRA